MAVWLHDPVAALWCLRLARGRRLFFVRFDLGDLEAALLRLAVGELAEILIQRQRLSVDHRAKRHHVLQAFECAAERDDLAALLLPRI